MGGFKLDLPFFTVEQKTAGESPPDDCSFWGFDVMSSYVDFPYIEIWTLDLKVDCACGVMPPPVSFEEFGGAKRSVALYVASFGCPVVASSLAGWWIRIWVEVAFCKLAGINSD